MGEKHPPCLVNLQLFIFLRAIPLISFAVISDVEIATLLDRFVNFHTYLKFFLPVNVKTCCFVFLTKRSAGASCTNPAAFIWSPLQPVRVKRAVILNVMINSGSTSLGVFFKKLSPANGLFLPRRHFFYVPTVLLTCVSHCPNYIFTIFLLDI